MSQKKTEDKPVLPEYGRDVDELLAMVPASKRGRAAMYLGRVRRLAVLDGVDMVIGLLAEAKASLQDGAVLSELHVGEGDF